MKKESLQTVVRSSLFRLGNIIGADAYTATILCYHSVSEAGNKYTISQEVVKEQLLKMKKYADFVSLDEIIDNSTRQKRNRPLISLTIDDGYADVMDLLPFVKKHNIPVALFVLSDPEKANRTELDHTGRLLTWNEIKILHKNGWTIGCHSATHADFHSLTVEQLRYEIQKAKVRIEKQLRSPVNYFAYPKGVWNKQIAEAVTKAGFTAAFTVMPGCVTRNTRKHIMPRAVIDSSLTLEDFPAAISFTTLTARRFFETVLRK